jgi:release factor glutamine methyltransferase
VAGSIAGLLDEAARRLEAAGADAPRLSAELIAARALGLNRLGLIIHAKEAPDPGRLAAFEALLARREAGEPVAYLLGEREFFSLRFRVTPDVLIPRPETECIVEAVQHRFDRKKVLRFADFGTGSGCLAVTLAHEFAQARGVAIDLSQAALAVAQDNARAHGVDSRLEFVRADFTRVALAAGSLDLVVANPPYVTETEYAGLSREVRDFEPRTALVSDEAGLAHLRGLLPVAARALKPLGLLLCEIGAGQGGAALSLAADPALGFTGASILKDYAGLDRVLCATRCA